MAGGAGLVGYQGARTPGAIDLASVYTQYSTTRTCRAAAGCCGRHGARRRGPSFHGSPITYINIIVLLSIDGNFSGNDMVFL